MSVLSMLSKMRDRRVFMVATEELNSSKSAVCWRTMTAVRAALVLAGITRGWTGGAGSTQAADGLELESGHHRTNMAKDAASSVGGVGASCCIEGCFKGLDLGYSGPVARGNAGDGVGNSSCHGRKYFGME